MDTTRDVVPFADAPIATRFGRLLRWPAGLALGSALATCSLIDSPSHFAQVTPVRIASNGDSVLFKSPGESNNCALRGGVVSFVAGPRRTDGRAGARFSYERSNARPRNDVVILATEAGTLSISGQKQYSLIPANAATAWRPLQSLPTTGQQLIDKTGAGLSIAPRRPGHYFVRVSDERRRDAFAGTVMPVGGDVYVRDAVFTSAVPSYVADSEHDCGNWDTAEEAAKALQRVEASIPP